MSNTERSPSPLHLTPKPTTRIDRSEQTRTAILNAALDFLWSRPFREMTVNGLMATTGVSRSAFYHYFKDLHEVMESLLKMLQEEIFNVDEPWHMGIGDPVDLLRQTLAGLVDLLYERGPFLRAIIDAGATDTRLEKAWVDFMISFDDAGSARIEADQEQGLIPDLDARPVIFGLNRMIVYAVHQAFGRHPRKSKKPVLETIERICISTLYGREALENNSTPLVRK